tara:strand:- start:690 stop:878 length:189 start_codon:yes stop_codon:yes gene_type:complete
MQGPFNHAMKHAEEQENVIKKEFIVYRRVDDKIYITKTTRRYLDNICGTENDYIDSHETTVL